MDDRRERSRVAVHGLGYVERLRLLGERYTDFVERHEKAWELAMGFLAVVYVITGLVTDAAEAPAPELDAVEFVLTVVFVAEFASRFAAARNRTEYLRGHWVDLVALIPVARGLRLARLVRVLRLGRTFAGLARVAHQIERLAAHRGLAVIVVTWVAVMVLTSLAFWFVERDANPALREPLDALWWGVATLTGGDPGVSARTPEGRLATGVLLVVGVALFTSITAVVTSFLLTRRHAHTGDDIDPDDYFEYVVALREGGLLTEREATAVFARLAARAAPPTKARPPDTLPRHVRLRRRAASVSAGVPPPVTDAYARPARLADGSSGDTS